MRRRKQERHNQCARERREFRNILNNMCLTIARLCEKRIGPMPPLLRWGFKLMPVTGARITGGGYKCDWDTQN